MNKRVSTDLFPTLRLVSVKLVNVWYRSKTPVAEMVSESTASTPLSGKITYYFSHKRKSSFTLKTTNEIECGNLSFRVRHEAKFASATSIEKHLYSNEKFATLTMNTVMPFTSELFAYLSAKTIGMPIIAPDALRGESKSSEGE